MVYHGELWSTAKYANLVQGASGAARVEAYEQELEANKIDDVGTGFVYLFRDPALTQHHYDAEKVHDYVWQVVSGRGEFADSSLKRMHRILGSEHFGYHAP